MRKVLSFMLVVLLLLTAVVPALAQDRPSLTDILSSGELGSFTSLLAAIDAAGLSETLSGEGPFTILAPTDEAFAASLEAMGMTAEEVMADPDALADILMYHVIPGRYFFRNLTSGPTLDTALEGEAVTFDLTGGAFTVNGVNISNPDNLISNGVVLVIDGVLVPPSMMAPAEEATPEATEEPVVAAAPVRPSLTDILSSGELGSFTSLLAAIDAAGLSDTLSGAGPFTILAPTDEAFAASLEAMGMTADEVMADPDALADILMYHVIPGRYFFRNLTSGPTLDTALEGETVTFDLTGGAFTVNGVNISNPDNLISNGVVLVIDGVLVPPSMAAPVAEVTAEPTAEPTQVVAAPPARPSISELLSAGDLGSFTMLLAAIDATGLSDTLNGEGPFTVFAPTDEAFTALLEDIDLTPIDVMGQPDLVRDILMYHVVPGRYFFRNLTSDPTLATALDGQTVDIVQQGNTFTVNNANITDVDNIASNGVVFVIDSVLMTPEQTAMLAPSGAHIRAAHFSPDAGAVDVYVNGDLELENVSFGTIGEWMDVRPGNVTVAVAPTGTEPGDATTITVAEGDYVTAAVTGTAAQDSIRVNLLREDYSAVPESRVRLSVFQAIEGASAVDVFVNGELLIGALGYPGSLGDNDGFDIREVGAATYDIQVRLAGTDTVIFEQSDVTFSAGDNVLVALIGTPGLPSIATSATTVQ